MIITLLIVTFIISLLVCFATARVFHKPLVSIVNRLIPEDISLSWVRYLQFAIYVVGISGGVRIWELEKYITPQMLEKEQNLIIVLNADRWALEIYRTVISTLSGIAWMLLVFFVVALIAYVIVRLFESKKSNTQ